MWIARRERFVDCFVGLHLFRSFGRLVQRVARGCQTFGHQLLLRHRLELVGIARWPTFALPDSKSSLTNLLLPCLIYGPLLQA